MSSGDENCWESAIDEPPNRGSFSFSSAAPTACVTREVWHCPFCDHELSYVSKTKDVAELAANSHIARQHRSENVIVILPDAGQGTLARALQRESSPSSREDSPNQR